MKMFCQYLVVAHCVFNFVGMLVKDLKQPTEKDRWIGFICSILVVTGMSTIFYGAGAFSELTGGE